MLIMLAQAPAVSPGINFFSLQQDIEIGSESSTEAEKTLPVVRRTAVNSYFRTLGQRLARHSTLPKLRYRFRIVNSKDIHSVGFPGGSIYVSRGLIELAADESEVASLLAHEIGHIAARHGTAQLSRQLLVQAPMSIATGLPTQEGWKDQLMKLGVSFGADASFVRYSRDQELEANLIAIRLLTGARLDAHALPAVLEKIIEAQNTEGIRLPAFAFNHPQVENLSAELEDAIAELDTKPFRAVRSAEFASFQSALQRISWPVAEKETAGETANETLPNVFAHPEEYYRLSYPEAWQVTRTGPNGAIVAPADGIQNSPAGDDLTRGAMFDMFSIPERPMTLEQATNRLIVFLRQRNQTLRAVPGAQTYVLIDNQPGLRTVMLAKSSATDSSEVIWLVTRIYYQTLFYMVLVAPEEEFPEIQPVFEQMIRSTRLR
jgi:Zn-dependent protease with chaperone function